MLNQTCGVQVLEHKIMMFWDMQQCRFGIARLKSGGTRAETRFDLSAKRTSPFKSAGVSVKSTTGSRGVRISGNCIDRVPTYSTRLLATHSTRIFHLQSRSAWFFSFASYLFSSDNR